MGVKKLSFISSLQELSASNITMIHMANGSVKARITYKGKEVFVSRSDLVDKIEILSKKTLKISDPEVLKSFSDLKSKIIDNESFKSDGYSKSFHSDLVNRLEEIGKSLSRKVGLQESPLKQDEISVSESAAADNLSSKAKQLGFTDEEIKTLGTQLETVILQHEKALQSDEMQRFFGTTDPIILRKLFIQNVTAKNSRFNIESKIFKLRGERIYLKKIRFSQGGESIVYKIHQLSLANFTISEVVRKQMRRDISPDFLQIIKENFENEYSILHKTAELVCSHHQLELLDAFQAPPYKICFKEKNGVQFAYLEGAKYLGDLFDLLARSGAQKPGRILPAFDLLIKGISFLHHVNIIHVDIKLENIFLESIGEDAYRCRLGDFGRAAEFDQLSGKIDRLLLSTPGYTPDSESPKKSTHQEALHRLSSFQLGVCLFSALTNGFPFRVPKDSDEFLNLNQSFVAGLRRKSSSLKIPEAAIKFIERLLDRNPEQRPIGPALLQAWEEAKRAMPEIFPKRI